MSQTEESRNCTGCHKSTADFGEKAANLIKGVASFAKYATSNARVSDTVFESRRKTCEDCQVKDSSGERLYRVGIFKKATCGKFFMQRPMSDPKVDGCGCILQAKWSVPDEACPLGFWGTVETANPTIRPRDLENLPEGFSLIEGIPSVVAEYGIPLTLMDGRRILISVNRIDKVYAAGMVVGIKAVTCVEAYGHVLLVKEHADDIQTAISIWEKPAPIVAITYAELQTQAAAKGLNVVNFDWPFVRFNLLNSSYQEGVQTNLRFVRNVSEFLDQVKAKLESFREQRHQ